MVEMLVVGVCLSLFVLLICLIWPTPSTTDAFPQQTMDQCKAALCVFRLLVDPKEEDYLRTRLPQLEFRALLRKRLWLAMRCLVLLSRHATFLATLGQNAALSGDPDVARMGARLAISSLQLKINLLAAEAAVVMKWLLPASPLLVCASSLMVRQRIHSLAGE